MDCNPLVIGSCPPAGRDAGRWTGWPFFQVRLEDLSPAVAAALGRLIRAAGGSARPVGRGPTGPARFAAGPARGPARRGGRAVILDGSGRQFETALRAARRLPALRAPAAELGRTLEQHTAPARRLVLRHGVLDLGREPAVMGILNVTPDSFSDGGRFAGRRAAVRQALRMAADGARIIDVGAESTRPGSAPVPIAEELRRLMPVLEALVPAVRRLGPGRPLISVDTYKAEVARRAAAAGADLINDISGFTLDPAMPAIVADTGLPVVIQHLRGRPATMGRPGRYAALLPEIARFLRRQIDLARRAGVHPDRIVVDPGIGFGKRRRDSLAILRRISLLRGLGRPILVGASRKSFIGGALELPVHDRLEGSLAAEALAIAGGADIIRAHDVREAVRVVRLCAAVLRDGSGHGR
jgi:dihydropteroate synthase